MKNLPITLFLSTNSKGLVDKLEEYFETYYVIKVPIGYSESMFSDDGRFIDQYHVLLKNCYTNSKYLRDEKCEIIKL